MLINKMISKLMIALNSTMMMTNSDDAFKDENKCIEDYLF